MARSRGSIAFLMNSLSSGSSSSRSVCGDGTLTSSISSSLQRRRDSLASRSFLISVASIFSPLGDLGAAFAEPLLDPRPQYQNEADGEDRCRERAQHEHRIIVIGNLQCLVERAFGELAEDEPDHQADQRIAMSS